MQIDIDYIAAICPIVLTHIFIPPLSYFYKKECIDVFDALYQLLPREFTKRSFVEDLILDHSEKKKLQVTWVTHIFVHGDYHHLFSNLEGAIVYGYPVYKEFGAQGLWILFLSGGIIASIPSPLHEGKPAELSRWLDNVIPTAEEKNKGIIPNFAKRIYNDSREGFKTTISKLVIPTKLIGSSGYFFYH